MDDIGASLVVILITTLVIVGIFWFTNKSKKGNEAALSKMAEQHGWKYEPIAERLAWGAHFTGKNWELITESRSIGQPGDSGSSNIDQVTRWWSDLSTPARFPLWIGPRLSDSQSPSVSFAIPLAEIFGIKNQPPGDLKEIDLGISEISKKYVIMADPQMDPVELRMSPISRMLMEWTGVNRPLIVVSSRTVEITIHGSRLEKPQEIEQLVRLGEAILQLSQ